MQGEKEKRENTEDTQGSNGERARSLEHDTHKRHGWLGVRTEVILAGHSLLLPHSDSADAKSLLQHFLHNILKLSYFLAAQQVVGSDGAQFREVDAARSQGATAASKRSFEAHFDEATVLGRPAGHRRGKGAGQEDLG